MKRPLRVLGLLAIFLAAYLLLWPVEIDPVAWDPAPPPALTGPYAPNDRLAGIERVGEGTGIGPEDVAVDQDGRVYGGMIDGRIIRMAPDGVDLETFAETGGRPLGLHFDAAGNLIVADAHKGLLSVAPDGTVSTLTTEAGGLPFKFTDDVDIGRDGTIYFSDASAKFGLDKAVADIIEHGGNGRLLAYDPRTGETRVLLPGLQFANGVAVSPDQTFVLVAETGAYRIRRYWLEGPKAGKAEIFIDNLPGFPDGVSSNGRGVFWVAIVNPRNPTADSLAPSPFLRRLVWRFPEALRPQPEAITFVLGLDSEGRVVHNLQDTGVGYGPITSVQQHGGVLYFGSLSETAIGRIAAP